MGKFFLGRFRRLRSWDFGLLAVNSKGEEMLGISESSDAKMFGEYIQSLEHLDQIVALLNHKYAANHENEEKAEVLTEILNEVKLLLMDTPYQELH